MSTGQSPYVPMQTMHTGHMHPHTPGMPMSMPQTMVDLPGKSNSPHMGGQTGRGMTERKIRAPVAAGPTKRAPRGPRSGATRAPSIQAQTPTTPNIYPSQPGPTSHPIYQQAGYNQWMQSQPMPNPQQPPPMMPTYPNNPQMKQQYVMQNVRPPGVPGRPSVQYTNPPMQQQPPPQQQQQQQQPGQPSQMSGGYIPDPSSMMMTSAGANSIPQNANRPPGVVPSVKRKLGDTQMYTNEQPQYATPPKMSLPSTGKIKINKKIKINFTFIFSWSNATISTKSSNDATNELYATRSTTTATTTTTDSSLTNVCSRTNVFSPLYE
jgi:hypothetical protein